MVNMNITRDEEFEVQLTHEEWQAFLRKFEECTCTPGSALACPSCREYNRRKYDWDDDPKHYKTNGVY